MYEIIDETLKLASCGINDLTLKQTSQFLSQWEDGATLGSLTLFDDPRTGYLVLNKDHFQYEFYLKLAKDYLSASEKELKTYKERFGDKLEEEFYVMDEFREHRLVWDELKKIEHQGLVAPDDRIIRGVLCALEKEQTPTCFLISQAYS